MRFDWGVDGLAACGAGAAAIVIVDVLRFTTAVSVAVARGAEVLPYVWGVGDAARRPRSPPRRRARRTARGRRLVAVARRPARRAGRDPAGPAVAQRVDARVRGRGPDGTAWSCWPAACATPSAVADVAAAVAGPVAVVAAGERWHGDLGALRPAVEDLLGRGRRARGAADRRRSAGPGSGVASVSPEAAAAIAAFAAIGDDVEGWLAATGLGARAGRPGLGRRRGGGGGARRRGGRAGAATARGSAVSSRRRPAIYAEPHAVLGAGRDPPARGRRRPAGRDHRAVAARPRVRRRVGRAGRQGVPLHVDADDEASARAEVDDMCQPFLTNPVIEDATITVTAAAGAAAR